MTGRRIKILIVEDNPYDAELIVHVLKKGGFAPEYRRVETRAGLEAALAAQSWDLVTCDHSMPSFSAPQALDIIIAQHAEIPVIIVSGEIDLALAVSLMKKGAWDYVQKSDLARLPLSIERELENAELLRQRQETLNALHRSEQNLRAIFENTYDALIIADENGHILDFNPAFLQLYEISRPEALKLNVADLSGQQPTSDLMTQFIQVLNDDQAHLFEWESRRFSDRRSFAVEVGLKRVLWNGQERYLAAIRNIEERKALESRLREREGIYRLVTEKLRDTVWMMDMNLKTTWISPSVIKTRGFSLEELQAMPLDHHLTPASLQQVMEDMVAVMAPERLADPDCEIIHTGEYEYIRKDGSTLWTVTSMILTRDQEGRPDGILCVARDISERKQAERELREQRSVLQALVRFLPLDFWIRNREGRVVLQSAHGKTWWGDVEGKVPEDLPLDAQTLEAWEANFRLALGGEMVSRYSEYQQMDQVRYVQSLLAPVRADEEIIGVVGANLDISPIRRVEQEMKTWIERFKAIATHLLDYVFYTRLDEGGNYQVVWREGGSESVFGYTLQEIDQMPGGLESAIYADDRLRLPEYLEIIKENRPVEGRIRVFHKNGQLRWLNCRIWPEWDEASQRVTGYYTMVRDVTEQVSIEEALQENEEYYYRLYENLADFVYVLDLQGNFLFINHSGLELTGYLASEIVGLRLQDIVPPEDRRRLYTTVWEDLSNTGVSRHELTIMKRSGQCLTVDCLANLISQNGEPQLIQGIARDISDQLDMRRLLEESEAKFRLLAEYSVAWIFIIQDDRYVYVNPSFIKASGYSEAELYAGHFWDIVHPDDQVMAREHARNRLNEARTPNYYDLKMITHSGSELWINVSAGLMQYKGHPALIVSAFDITERKAMEEQLMATNHELERSLAEMRQLQEALKRQLDLLQTQEQALFTSEQQYKTLLELIPQGVYELDLSGRVVFANRNALELFGYTDKDVEEGLNISALFLPREFEKAKTNVMKIAGGEKSRGSEYLCVKKSGTLFYALAYLAPVYENGQLKAFRGTILDIDERKRIENEIIRLNNDLEARVERRTRELEIANRELEAFSYMAGHDLRAPLRSIEGFSRILMAELGDGATPEMRHLVDVICRNVAKMRELIEDLLEFSKYNRQSIHTTRVDMQALAEEILQEIAASEPDRQVAWEIRDMLTAECDPSLIRQVLFNLCTNAWKFTRLSPEARIQIYSWAEGDETVYAVQDNGVGFDMRYYDRLFNVFQRLHSENEFEGTGLGLAIVQRIVNRHGGRVWAESEQGAGSCFYFSLPR